ncbi:glycosyltransferase family 2 protein [Acidovorax sp. Root217]|uniref:glycosyltransferase family 2 protein n=1 Tax=Acidovorax sp. Root217 TaxID=1736492 RepID=UPI0009E8A45A|nr:glycosyltransferase family 2 protein [Acidovorax sp. Root217]
MDSSNASAPALLSVVCPMYNEEAALDLFFAQLLPVLAQTGLAFEIVCVNDGSRDGTLARLQALCATVPGLRVVDLSRNFGKEAALTCGIDHALGAAVVPIDADLQDPPELILEMVRLWQQGFDVVLAQRTDRSADHLLKRKTSEWFYRLHNRISDSQIPPNVGDFRLMDRQVVDALKRLPERRRFMKGLFAWVGFRQATIPYTRPARAAGDTKFSGWGLWNLAVEGVTSFSTVPLRIWTYLGLAVALLAFGYGLVIVGQVLLFGRDAPGYASLITVVLFLGGLQLIGLGVLGEYLGRVYMESKGRPIYLVREPAEPPQHTPPAQPAAPHPPTNHHAP